MEEDIAALRLRLSQLTRSTTPTIPNDCERRILSRRLAHIDRTLHSVEEAVSAVDPGSPDRHLMRQYREQLDDVKRDMHGAHSDLLSLELEESDDLHTTYSRLERLLFDCSLKVSRLNTDSEPVSDVVKTSEHKGVRLPKLEVPVFDGGILNWRRFWEQFLVSVHDRSSLSDSKKFVYLQHALRDGSARVVIDGLSQSGENYAVAVECLRSRYDRPRLIHQAHVKSILEAPPLKEGNGRELRKLHDLVQQHLRALKSMDSDPSGPFITSYVRA